MGEAPISAFPVRALGDVLEDLRSMILGIQEKAGFMANVFLVLAHRPNELRAFMASHDARLEGESGLTQAGREMIKFALKLARKPESN